MKRVKRLFAVTLSMIMLLTVFPFDMLEVWAAEESGFQYQLINGGTEAEITKYVGTETIFSTPYRLGGKPVTSIGYHAFYYSDIQRVTIREGVTKIGTGAFQGSSVERVDLPEGVEMIGEEAFFNSDLTEITLPASLTEIGNRAFQYCNLQTVILPEGLVYLGEAAFANCISLTSVTIPASLTTLDGGPFGSCDKLVNIEIAEEHPTYVSQDGVMFSKDKTQIILYPAGRQDQEYIIPESVTAIGASAFYGNEYLETITIPDRVTYLGDYAFACSTLRTVAFENAETDKRTSLGAYIFEDCSLLSNVSLPNDLERIGEGMFSATGLKTIVIPESVTTIGNRAFSFCDKLQAIEIPSGVTTIEEEAFRRCEKLETVVIPAGVTSIQLEAFVECKLLKSIEVSPDNAYYSSEDGVLFNKDKTELLQYPAGSSRTRYAVPTTVKTIKGSAFFSCKTLQRVRVLDHVKTVEEYAFYGLWETVTIYGRGSAISTYAEKEGIPYVSYSVSSLGISAPPTKQVYWEGETFDPTGLQVTAYYNYGDSVPLSAGQYTLSGHDWTKDPALGSKTIKVSYGGKSASFTVTLKVKPVQSITITSLPYQTSFMEWEEFNTVGLKVEVLDADNVTKAVTNYEISGYSSTPGVKTITITYGEKSTSYQVTVEKLVSIEIASWPDKINYKYGEPIDYEGMVINAVCESGVKRQITGGYSIYHEPLDPGSQTITVTYRGKTATFSVFVQPKVLVGLLVTLPSKLTYWEGEAFDPTGLEVKALYEDATTEVVTEYTLSGYDSTPGTKTITVSHRSKDYTFNVIVKEIQLYGIVVTTMPNKLTYKEGEELDLAGMVVTATYNNGKTEAVTDYTVSGYDSEPGVKTLVISYQGATFPVIVVVEPMQVEPEKMLGDVDGDEAITSTDARLTLQYYADKIHEADLDTEVADVDGDGQITSTDARLILQKYAGKIEEFPAQA